MLQLVILISGVTAIALTQARSPKKRKYASIVGLAGQPAWLYITYSGEQYGMFLLCCVYTVVWAWGVYMNWFSKEREDGNNNKNM